MSIDIDMIWDKVQENNKKLESCKEHNFSIDLTPVRKFGKRYACEHCGGEIDSINKSWYEKGVEHGKLRRVLNELNE
jgi:hypothetical protein